MNLRKNITFGFEQTFTILNWWEDEGFCNTSNTELKLKKMDQLAKELAKELGGNSIQSKDIWDNLQYEVQVNSQTQFTVTMDPGSIEVKTIPKLINELTDYLEPLFVAAKNAQVVPFRSWWYGVQTGTEGGCHVNMGAQETKSNCFMDDPLLLVKYAAFVHNRSFLTYPFMNIDVGPGGNAQRMDEKENYDKVKKLFTDVKKQSFKDLDDVYNYFKNSNIITDKSSYPSFRKLKSPLNMIEDRAQQSLRAPSDFFLVANLRLKILESIQDKKIEALKDFHALHETNLTSFKQWECFQSFCNDLKINPVDYQIFFDRSYPKLFMGQNVPVKFILKQSKRPRSILEVYKNKQGEVTGKKVNTNKKRLELYYNTLTEEQFEFKCNHKTVEKLSETQRHNGPLNFGDKGTSYFAYLDVELDKSSPIIEIELIDKLTEATVESCQFNLKTMLFE